MTRDLQPLTCTHSSAARIPLWLLLVLCAAGSLVQAEGPAPPPLPRAVPDQVGMSAARLAEIDHLVQEGLERKQMPGCVVLIGRRGKVVFEKAYGHRQLEPQPIPMTLDTVFDLASLTKPIATATSVMVLVEQGKLRLRDPVAQHLPDFGQGGKGQVTVTELLIHQGGLIADNPLADFTPGQDAAFAKIFALRPQSEPGTRFVYSDVGFLVLGELVRRISGDDLHQFSQKHIFAPLGMSETGFLPAEPLRQRAAPTERRDDRWMQGEVHDPRAYLLGGIAGHAGLFSTAADLAIYAQMMLGHGGYGEVRVLSPRSVELMTHAYPVSSGYRGLGWDIETGYSSNRGELLSGRAYGHGGFTGTVIWIDPELELFYIFLSNRLHPQGKGVVNALAGRIGTVAAAAVQDLPPSTRRERRPGTFARRSGSVPVADVLPGIDVLVQEKFARLKGKRLGLIANHTSRDRNGRSTASLLKEAPDVQLTAIFSPEHGIAGKLDVSKIADTRDPETQLPVYSLYGETRKPTPAMLANLDLLIFDIQDIGSRFYTYVSTMGLAMEAAAEHKVAFMVLDRPNPINGIDVEGPVLEEGRESFVGYHRIPVRHGMTVGELARMFRAERQLPLELEVVEVRNWTRSQMFDATGLVWVNPSPNMRSLTQALLYPGIGLLETTNLSVGRGTDTPFEVLGAPWLDSVRLSRDLNNSGLPGVRFVPIEFTPTSSRYEGKRCQGINLLVVDREAFLPVRTGLTIARQLRRLHEADWDAAGCDRLLAHQKILELILKGEPVAAMEAEAAAELRSFQSRRQPFLLYP